MKTYPGLLQQSPFIGGLAQIANERQSRSVASEPCQFNRGGDKGFHLAAGSILRLEEQDVKSLLIVENGAIWLTDTPATHDYVLESGEEFVKRG